jgi:hypothetical protein
MVWELRRSTIRQRKKLRKSGCRKAAEREKPISHSSFDTDHLSSKFLIGPLIDETSWRVDSPIRLHSVSKGNDK